MNTKWPLVSSHNLIGSISLNSKTNEDIIIDILLACTMKFFVLSLIISG